MTDLTDKWEKGELVGEYWCEITESPYPERVYLPTCDNDIIVKVLAPVPNYEKYLSLTYAKEEDEKIIAEYEEENAKLKELLKECRSPINYALCLNLSKEEKIEFKNLLAKIKQALGEDK